MHSSCQRKSRGKVDGKKKRDGEGKKQRMKICGKSGEDLAVSSLSEIETSCGIVQSKKICMMAEFDRLPLKKSVAVKRPKNSA
jgi:hypothetical protein